MSRPASCFSAPTSRLPPRTRASPAIRTRFSSTFSAALLIVGSSTIQPELDAAVAAEQPLDRGPRLARVDVVGEAARGAERQPEEFELVGRGPRALGEQVEAARAHLRIVLVGEQFDAVVERADGRQQVVAQARAEQAGEFVGFHARLSPCRAGLTPIGPSDSGMQEEWKGSPRRRKPFDRLRANGGGGKAELYPPLPFGLSLSKPAPSCVRDLEIPRPNPISAPVSGGHYIIIATIADDAIGWRLDRALAAAVPTLSRERLKALICERLGARPAGRSVRDPAVKASRAAPTK